MKYTLFFLLIFTFFACEEDTSTPKEVSQGLKEYAAILGDFNFNFSKIKETNTSGDTQNILSVAIFKNTILEEADKNMLSAFSSGIAYYIFKNLTDKQVQNFDGIAVKISLDDLESSQTYLMKDLATIQKFDLSSKDYLQFVKEFDLKSMYSAYGALVKNQLNYEAFEKMMLTGFEDDKLENVLLVGAGFFQEEDGLVVHLRYVVIYETAANRRHSIYYLTDDGDTLIDGFQL